MKNDDHHEESTLPPEIEELYRLGQITTDDFDPLMKFRDELIRSAPQPEKDFKNRLGDHLFTTNKVRKHSRWNHPLHRPSLRMVLTLCGVLLLTITVVLAVSGSLERFIDRDAGLNEVFRSGEGIMLDQSKTVDNYTIQLEWAYADANRLSIGFTMPDFVCSTTYTFCDVSVSVIDQAGIELAQLDSQADVGQTERVYLYNFARPNLAPDGLSYTFQLRVTPFGVTNLSTANDSGIIQTRREDLNDPIDFTLNIPVDGNVRLLTEPQSTIDHDVTITLQRVIVAPSQTRVSICYLSMVTERTWMAIPNLTVEGVAVSGGGAATTVSGIGESAGEVCNEFTYDTAMFEYTGEWQLEITGLVGMGEGGNDQQRISGSWIFMFVVP